MRTKQYAGLVLAMLGVCAAAAARPQSADQQTRTFKLSEVRIRDPFILHMVYCHEWVQIKDGAIAVVRLKDDLSDFVADPVTLFRASEAPWNSADKDRYITDGPFLYRTRTGKLLMIWSRIKNEGDALSREGKTAAKPLFRDPVHDGAADPVLCWNRAESKWLMFYTNRRANVPNTPGVSWVHGTRIGIAESSDGGATWTYRGTADIDYGQGDYSHWAPEVIEHNGTYHMYLSFVPGIFTHWNAPRDIIHLTSKDLLKWRYESTLKLASGKVIDATVIQLPDGTWRMWYKNEGDHSWIYYADSPDLFTWKDRGKAIGDQSGEGAKAFCWKGRYWMLVDVWDGLGVYCSDDCSSWTRQKRNLLREPGQRPTDRGRGGHPDVVLSGNRAFLFYFIHQGGRDAEPNDPYAERRSLIQVVELQYKDGELTCDRDKPTHIQLLPKP